MLKTTIIKRQILFVIICIVGLGQLSFTQTTPTINHGDDAITDAHESFKDRGSRHYQDLVNVTPFANGFRSRVNVVYGNLIHSRQDLYIPGRGLPIRIVFTYNSGSFFNGRYGFGWQLNYNVRYITNSENGNIIIVRPDDRTDIFEVQEDGSYTATYGVRDQLLATDNGYQLIVWRDGWNNNGNYAVYHFDSQDHHYVTKIEDRNGNALLFTYNQDKSLDQIADEGGRHFAFSYNNQHLSKITDVAEGREWTFEYDANGDMVKTTNPLGSETTYTYSEDCHDLLTITNALESMWTFTYDDDYAVTSVSNPENPTAFGFEYRGSGPGSTLVTNGNGQVTTFSFDEKEKVTVRSSPLGAATNRNWNDAYQIASITNAEGHISHYTYDDRGNILTYTDGLGNQSTWTWDRDINRPTQFVNANGKISTFQYDDVGNLLTATDPLNQNTTFTYDEFGQPLTQTDALGRQTQYAWDQFGNLERVIDAAGGETSFAYNIRGNVRSTTNPNGYGWLFEYDVLGRPTTSNDAIGNESRYVYDAVGNLTTFTDPENNQTIYEYDGCNRRLSTTDALGGVTTYTYDPAGNLSSQTDPGNRTLAYVYDAAGRLSSVIDGNGAATAYNYDGLNQLITYTDANQNTRGYTHDAAGRLISSTDPMGMTTQYEYNALGNLTGFTDRNGNSTQYIYDDGNRTISVTDPEGGIRTFDYDDAGNLLTATNPMSHTTSYQYDALNRLTQTTLPMGGTRKFTYDPVGNLIQRTDGNGDDVVYGYDGLNRRITTAYGMGGDLRSYDAVGNLVELENQGGINDHAYYTYDALGRLTQKRINYGGAIGEKIVGYDYDGSGNRISMTTPNGATTTYKYDMANRLTQTTAYDGTTSYTYDAGGRLIGQTFPNAMTTTYGWDSNNRPTTFTVVYGTGTTHIDRTYIHDAVGNKISEVRNHPNRYRNIIYNALSKPTQIIYGEGIEGQGATEQTEIYTYNLVGRRTTKSIDGQVTTYEYNQDGRLITETTPTDVITYTHDGNGSRIKRTSTEGDVIYTYDYTQRLTEFNHHDGRYLVNQYDPMGNILKRSETYGTFVSEENFIYTGSTPIESWNDHGILTRFNPGVSIEYNLHSPEHQSLDFAVYDSYGTSVMNMQPQGPHAIDFDEMGVKLEGTPFGPTWNQFWMYDPYSLMPVWGFDVETGEILSGGIGRQTTRAYIQTSCWNNSIPAVHSTRWAFYLQDEWTISDRFSLNYGLRLEKECLPHLDDAFFSPSIAFNFSDQTAPRIGFAYDNTGNAAVYANDYGKYNFQLGNTSGDPQYSYDTKLKWGRTSLSPSQQDDGSRWDAPSRGSQIWNPSNFGLSSGFTFFGDNLFEGSHEIKMGHEIVFGDEYWTPSTNADIPLTSKYAMWEINKIHWWSPNDLFDDRYRLSSDDLDWRNFYLPQDLRLSITEIYRK